ncbi:MAG: hypothetical protein AAGM38_00270 [Pseudomonadota bacterium]
MRGAIRRRSDARGALTRLCAAAMLLSVLGAPAAAGPVVQGVATLRQGDVFDLDRGRLGVIETADIARVRISADKEALVPRPGALIGLRGDRSPDEASCRKAQFSERGVLMHRLRPGRYFCIRTGEGRMAALRVLKAPIRGRGQLTLEHRTFR